LVFGEWLNGACLWCVYLMFCCVHPTRQLTLHPKPPSRLPKPQTVHLFRKPDSTTCLRTPTPSSGFSTPSFPLFRKPTPHLHTPAPSSGFSTLSFQLFRKPDNTPYLARCPNADGCTPNDRDGYPPGYGLLGQSSPLVVKQSVAREASVSSIVTPAVRDIAARHFGCADIQGAELENYGGASTAGSHWEKRLFKTEYMTGSSSKTFQSVYSAFTLALLQDSGWYIVSWDNAGELVWGRGKGCSYANSKCIEGDSVLSGFCASSDQDESSCTHDRRYLGKCGLAEWSSDLRSEHQYFPDPKKGGLDQLLDFCPSIVPYTNKRCDNSSSQAQVVACGSQDCFGSSFGASSRCMQTSLLLEGWEVPNLPSISAGCYPHECANGHLLITLPTGTKHNCSSSTETLVPGYTGKLFCPPTEDLCFDQAAFINSIKKSTVIQEASDVSVPSYQQAPQDPNTVSAAPCSPRAASGWASGALAVLSAVLLSGR